MKKFLLTIFVFYCSITHAETVQTFYGPIEVEEPVLLELIESKAMQRLKHLRQYGHFYYVFNSAEYSRYDHCLGVWAILRLHGCSLKEQIAGLLHDISHTTFSHTSDWMFKRIHAEEGYADYIHVDFLQRYGIAEILQKYGMEAKEFAVSSSVFPALEQSCPHLCADRIDYNVQGAYHEGIISQEEARDLIDSLQFLDGKWVCSSPELMKKVCMCSLMLNKTLWSGVPQYVSHQGLAKALHRGIEIGLLSLDDLYFGYDDTVWQALKHSSDPIIESCFLEIECPEQYYLLSLVPTEIGESIYLKFRGIDPWIVMGDSLIKLTEYDPEYGAAFAADKAYYAQERYLIHLPTYVRASCSYN